MIIYFTGTGNSRYLAELAAQKLSDTAVDATKLIKDCESPKFESEKPYVFISPVYAWRLPRVFCELIRRSEFRGNEKSYFIIDCGSEIGAAGNYAKKLAEQMKLEYMGTAEVIMPENYIIMFSAPAREEDSEIISAAAEKTEKLCERISAGEPFEKKKNTFSDHLYSDIINPMFYTFYIGSKKFYATDACISCGKCVSACMLNTIKLKDGRPEWGRDCTHCMACISKCPTEAIEYGKNTNGKRRYYFANTEKGDKND